MKSFEPVLDYKKAVDNPTIVHNYDDYFMHIPSFNADNKRNIVVDGVEEHGMWRRNLLRAKSSRRANMKFRLRNSV